MIRAIFKNGVILPLDPVPPEWSTGLPLRVEAEEPADSASAAELDEWARELEILAADVDPADIVRLETALAEADAQAKALVRREMGLP